MGEKTLGVDHDKIILLSTPSPTIPMLGKNCCYNVIVFYVGNKRCCIVLYDEQDGRLCDASNLVLDLLAAVLQCRCHPC